MRGYIAFIHPPEDGSEYAVTFPDVPGCATSGATFEEAVAAAREALSGHLDALRSDGDPVPAARALEAILADPEAREEGAGAIPNLVVPFPAPVERVRVNIMIDKGTLLRTDKAAEERGLTRSAFIEAALAPHLGA